MGKVASERAREFYAETYEATVADWPGEVEFYRTLGAEAHTEGQAVLEVACGTGRVAIRLAREGFEVSALYGDFFGDTFRDASSEIVWVARREE